MNNSTIKRLDDFNFSSHYEGNLTDLKDLESCLNQTLIARIAQFNTMAFFIETIVNDLLRIQSMLNNLSGRMGVMVESITEDTPISGEDISRFTASWSGDLQEVLEKEKTAILKLLNEFTTPPVNEGTGSFGYIANEIDEKLLITKQLFNIEKS